MPYDVDIGDGADALTLNQFRDALDGTYWKSGWDATLGTGDLEVDIAAGEGAINGGDVSTGSTQTVDFTGDPDPDDPRKAAISVDSGGNVVKTLGTAVPADPENEFRFRTWDPQPPAESVPGVVVAEVWLAAGETVLESADVRDRRVSNDAVENFEPTLPFGGRVTGSAQRLPEPRDTLAAAAVGTDIYAIGGRNASFNAQDTVYKFEQLTNSWTTVAPLPATRRSMGAVAVGNEIYVPGGVSGSGTSDVVYAYDTVTDSWSTVASLPAVRQDYGIAELDGLVYVIGGFDGSFNTQTSVYEYDPVGDSWTTVAPLPNSRALLTAAAVDGFIYAIGGDNGTNKQDTVYQYDPVGDSWTTVASLPVTATNSVAAPARGAIYVLGGIDSNSNSIATVYEYTPDSDSWITLPPIPTGLSSSGGASDGDSVYIIGGTDNNTNLKESVYTNFPGGISR